jgi:hypothetical protein
MTSTTKLLKDTKLTICSGFICTIKEYSGLKMIHLQQFNAYLKISWIKRFFSNLKGGWQKIMTKNIKYYGSERIFFLTKGKDP